MINDIEARLRFLENELPALTLAIQSITIAFAQAQTAISMLGQLPMTPGTASIGQVTITVDICGGATDPGAAVSVSGPNSFTSNGSANSSGVYTFNYPTAGSYTITITPTDTTHYQTTVATYTFSSGNYNETIVCETTSSWVCVPCCSELLPASLQLSDTSFGSCSVDWNGSAWVGSQLSTQLTVSTSCGSPTQGQTLVIYYLECVGGVFVLNISYNGCDNNTSIYFEYPSPSTLPADPNTVAQGVFSSAIDASSSSCSPLDLQFPVTTSDLPKLYSVSTTVTITA